MIDKNALVPGRRASLLFSVLTNVITLVSGLVLGFFLPKFVSIETYSYYKTYLLYADYLGIFHLGFINGLYLKYVKYDYTELPKDRFANYTKILFMTQAGISVFGLIAVAALEKSATVSPFIFLAFNIWLINLNCYFMLVDQFSMRFFTDAIIQLVQSFLLVVSFTVLLISKIDSYVYYLSAITLINIAVLVIHTIASREIIFTPTGESKVGISEVRGLIKKGFPVMISEYMGIIIIGIDSMIVNVFMTVEEFSVYAFAVSVVTLYFAILNVISKFIFPYLKRVSENQYAEVYEKMKLYIMILSALICGVTIAIAALIPLFLPKYNESIQIIRILGITALFKGLQILLCDNYFKVLSYGKGFVMTNVTAFVLGLVTDLVAVTIFHSMHSIAVASVISFAIWYVVSDTILRKKMNVSKSWGYPLMITIALLYYFCISIDPLVGFVLYYLVVAVIAAVVWKKYTLFKKAHPASLD